MCLAYLPGPGAQADVVLGKGYLAQRGLSHPELTLCSLPSHLRGLEPYMSPPNPALVPVQELSLILTCLVIG